MKINDILDKIVLEFAAGGKLALSDYKPYISNGNEEIADIQEIQENEEI